MNQLTRLAIQGYLDQNCGAHPSTVIAIPFTLAEWESILRDSPGEAVQQWKPASEKPTSAEEYLCWFQDRHAVLGYDLEHGWAWDNGDYMIARHQAQVTHWMPLPSAPMEK